MAVAVIDNLATDGDNERKYANGVADLALVFIHAFRMPRKLSRFLPIYCLPLV
jgi:hypothetical protein